MNNIKIFYLHESAGNNKSFFPEFTLIFADPDQKISVNLRNLRETINPFFRSSPDLRKSRSENQR